MCLRCLLRHILSLVAYTFRENREFVFIIIVQFMISANSRMRFGLQIVFVCLYITPSHYHHCANLSEDTELTDILSSLWVRLSIFSQSSIIQYVGLCVFSVPISSVMIVRIYILCLIIIIKSEVWTITHCLGLGHETMVCAVCLSLFLSIPSHNFLWDIITNPCLISNGCLLEHTRDTAFKATLFIVCIEKLIIFKINCRIFKLLVLIAY